MGTTGVYVIVLGAGSTVTRTSGSWTLQGAATDLEALTTADSTTYTTPAGRKFIATASASAQLRWTWDNSLITLVDDAPGTPPDYSGAYSGFNNLPAGFTATTGVVR